MGLPKQRFFSSNRFLEPNEFVLDALREKFEERREELKFSNVGNQDFRDDTILCSKDQDPALAADDEEEGNEVRLPTLASMAGTEPQETLDKSIRENLNLVKF